MASLDLLFRQLGEDPRLRKHGRAAVLQGLDRLDARWWIDHRPLPMVSLVEALWRRCRYPALCRRSLVGAKDWIDGLGGGQSCAGAAESRLAVERARRLGIFVAEPADGPAEWAYIRSCLKRGSPALVVDLGGRYEWLDHLVVSAAHASVRLLLPDAFRDFTAAERADIEASCSVCQGPNDVPACIAVRTNSAQAIIPRGLAIPLACRVRDIAARPDRPASRPGR